MHVTINLKKLRKRLFQKIDVFLFNFSKLNDKLIRMFLVYYNHQN